VCHSISSGFILFSSKLTASLTFWGKVRCDYEHPIAAKSGNIFAQKYLKEKGITW
jgi:hypothetical protein